MNDLFSRNQFDWRRVINFPYDKGAPGKQVLNFFFSTDYDYRYEPRSAKLVESCFQQSKVFEIDAALMKFACEQVSVDGAFLEMGVCTGSTINFIAGLNPEETIYGFDSFAGLPTNWSGRTDYYIPKGVFGFKDPDMLPPVLQNVRLQKGLFKHTLPEFKKKVLHKQPIAFLHVDCDIYQSSVEVLTYLAKNIVPNTIIVFDEFYNYPGYELHEYKAFHEFLEETNRKAEYMAYNRLGEQVVVRMLT